MADVYENGFFTIAATAAEDSNGGLFSDQGNPCLPMKLSKSNLYVAQEPALTPRGGIPMLGFGQSPLLQRAWVFQERRLSSRVVHFAETQIIWECNSIWKSEDGCIDYDWTNESCSRDDTTDIHPFKKPINDATADWQRLVAAYSQLSITYVKDKLPALAAIVTRTMQSRPDDEYIAGMWKKTILRDILWSCGSLFRSSLPRHKTKVPTWSWASTPGPVWFALPNIFSATITNVTYEPVGPVQLGSVTGASIVLRGRSCPATALPRGPVSNGVGIDLDPEEVPWPELFKTEFCQDRNAVINAPLSEAAKQLAVVFIGLDPIYKTAGWLGLVLRQVSAEEHERVGRIELLFQGVYKQTSVRFGYQAQRTFISSLPIREFKII